MKSKDALRILGVSRITLMNYVKKGIIKVTELANGYYDYDDLSIYSFIGRPIRANLIYTRVSTYKQKSDLARQNLFLTKYCADRNIIIDKTYSEISSGIDLDRVQFNEMLADVFKYKIDKIIITHKDRLTRLSFITLQNIFKQFGTTIIVVFDKAGNFDNEMLDELISLMHYFSTKTYSNRKNKLITI